MVAVQFIMHSHLPTMLLANVCRHFYDVSTFQVKLCKVTHAYESTAELELQLSFTEINWVEFKGNTMLRL